MKQWSTAMPKCHIFGILKIFASAFTLKKTWALRHGALFLKKKGTQWQKYFRGQQHTIEENHLQLSDPAFHFFLLFPTHSALATLSVPGSMFSSLPHYFWSLTKHARKWAAIVFTSCCRAARSRSYWRQPVHPWAWRWGVHFLLIGKGEWWRWRNIKNDCRKQILLSSLVSQNNNSYLGHTRHFISCSS